MCICQAKISATAGIEAQQLNMFLLNSLYFIFISQFVWIFCYYVAWRLFLGRSESGHGATNCWPNLAFYPVNYSYKNNSNKNMCSFVYRFIIGLLCREEKYCIIFGSVLDVFY